MKTDEELESHVDLNDRVGKYVKATNTIFINFNYSAIQNMLNYSRNYYAENLKYDFFEEVILEHVENYFKVTIGKGVINSIIKIKKDNWNEDNITNALRPEALSLLADDWVSSFSNIKQSINLKYSKLKESA